MGLTPDGVLWIWARRPHYVLYIGEEEQERYSWVDLFEFIEWAVTATAAATTATATTALQQQQQQQQQQQPNWFKKKEESS